MELKGFQATELIPGANTYIKPPAEDPGPPPGFVDNTVYRYKIVDGEKVLIGTQDPFPEGWDQLNKNIKCRPEDIQSNEQKGEESVRYDWLKLWPQAKELLDTGKTCVEVAQELKIDRSVLYSKMYREGYGTREGIPDDNFDKEFDAAMAKKDESQLRKAATINQDFEKAFPPLGPAEEIKPISAPFGVEIPKQEEQISQYRPEDNDYNDEALMSYPYPVVELKKHQPNLGPIKIELIATLLAQYLEGMVNDQVTLGLTRGILDLQLPEVV